jgi:WD40 repeat protein
MKRLGIAVFVLCCIAVVVMLSRRGHVRGPLREGKHYRVKLPVSRCRFVADDTMLVVAAHKASVWDLNTGMQIFAVSDNCTEALVDFRRGRFVLGKPRGGIEVRDAATAELLLEYHLHKAMVSAIAVSEDGKLIASASAYPIINNAQNEGDYAIEIVEADSGRRIKSLTGHRAPVARMHFVAEGKELLSLSNDHTLKLWDVDRETTLKSDGIERLPKVVVVDGKAVVADTFFDMSLEVIDEKVALVGSRVWDIEKWQTVREFRLPSDVSVTVSVFAGNSDRALTGNTDGTISLWNLLTGHEMQRTQMLFANGAPVRCLSVSPSGKYVLAGGAGEIAGFNALSKGVSASEAVKIRLYSLDN